LKAILTGIADIVFPPRCPLCQAVLHDHGAALFCDACNRQIRRIGTPFCPACGLPFQTHEGPNHLCGECVLRPKAFSAARAAGPYETLLLEAVHRFKYLGKSALGKILGRFMAGQDYPDFAIASYTLIVPVPLHVKRLRERTFNQSLILARAIARKYAMALDFTSLKRHCWTQPQITLGKTDRQANVKGAFRIDHPERIAGEKILLIDDVYTTGSTLDECARLLVKNGAADVGVLTLARAI